LLAAVAAGGAEDAPMKLAILENEIARGEFEASVEIPIDLNDSEKTQHINDWRSCRERNANLLKHRGQAFSLILGQCTQLPQDKMKQDADWTAVSTSYDPLTLFRLIEKTALAQRTEDQHPFATIYDQELGSHSFRQETLSNAPWHERFNTKVDVGEAIGVMRLHKVLVECASQELHSQDFASLGAANNMWFETTPKRDASRALFYVKAERSMAISKQIYKTILQLETTIAPRLANRPHISSTNVPKQW
jgi:hypothetical protein